MTGRGRGGDGLIKLPKRNGRQWWRARLYWQDERTGKHRQRVVTFQADSRALALLRREAELEKARSGTAPSPRERKRFGEVADEWLATITVESSRRSYGSHVGTLRRAFGDWWLDVLTSRHLQDHLDSMGKSAGYVNSRRDVLVRVFAHAIKRGYAATNPAKDTTRKSTRLAGLTELGEEPKRSLSEEEAVAHLRDLRQHEPEAYPLVLLQYHLGCRFSELSALRHEDVDLEAGIVRIRRGQYRGVRGRTKGRYARVAGLPLDVRVMLQKHIARVRAEGYPGADELVFPRPPYGRRKHSNHWSASTMHAILVRSYRRLGLRGPGVDNPLRGTSHVARHTVATIAEGLATASVLRKVLGQTQEIQRRYQHPEHAQVIELSERVAERLKRKGGEDV